MKKPRVEDTLADALEVALGQRPMTEWQPFKERRWRVDCAYIDQKICIEVDGSRHFSHAKQRNDMEKRNALEAEGFTVLTYPAAAVYTKKRLPLVVEQIVRIMTNAPADRPFHTSVLSRPLR